ncbi:MAG: guanylate kinase [Desulfobulbaceae bacterium]|nr:guanylate kinase [Desulfobulbaceae bacterium]
MNRGTLFVISAPSGTGKTTILKQVMATVPGLSFSISHTTRAPRAGEQDGVDYHFVDRDRFVAMREAGAFLEWAEVHGNFYGTSLAAVEASLAAGTDIILDIDVQGCRQVRAMAGDAVSLFVVPPSWPELERRLTGRGTDNEETIRLRLANARKEMADIVHYDYVVVNDILASAVATMLAIIHAERSRHRRTADGAPMQLPAL